MVDPDFEREHARLVGMIERRPDVAPVIRWWLYHRWLSARAEVLRREAVDELLAEADFPPYLRAEWVHALLNALRREPSALCTDWLDQLRPYEPLDGGDADEQRVRLPLLGLLLAVAHAMAIEATTLSETVVWHVGIPKPVDLDALHKTLADAQWDGMSLIATCQHAAVVETLREHLVRLGELLQSIATAARDSEVLAPLRALPERARDDRVEPAEGPDGKPVFRGWNRFNLDEQRVQELLMGEQLYRDRGLAVRELYQNALDACRYRAAREEYLRQTQGRPTAWAGEIVIRQGTDESGRPYLDCADNGVGMGIAELTGVFSRAGARFADLTEFRDEKAAWARCDPPIELFPNSRFGIGVLSFFMLADEITITTCRMNRRTGLPGPTLKVMIAGPGHLFHVEEIADGGEPGTRVRLHLRSGTDVSCVRVLERLLGIAEFRTTARHDDVSIDWEPGVLRTRRGNDLDDLNVFGQTTASGDVVWCEHGGAVLVDGLLAHPAVRRGILPRTVDPYIDLRGAAVNLTGRASPRLSVDRTQILDDVSADVEQLLSAAIPDLVGSSPAFLGRDWLGAVTANTPRLADMVFEGWSATRSYFPADNQLGEDRDGRKRFHDEQPNPPLSELLDSVLLWRLLAHTPNRAIDELTGLVPELRDVSPSLDARPSDLTLLTGEVYSPSWVDRETLAAPGHVFEVADLIGRSPRAVAHRIRDLGMADVDPSCFPDRTGQYATEIELLRSPSAGGDWLSPTRPLPVNHVAERATELHISAETALETLGRYGFAPPPTSQQVLCSRNLDGVPPWLSPSDPLPVAHVVRAAVVLGSTTDSILRQFCELGFEPAEDLPDWLDEHAALRLAAVYEDTDNLDIGDVLEVSRIFDVSIAEARHRLEQLGLCVPVMPQSLTDDDRRVLSRDLDDIGPWLRRRDPVPAHHFLRGHWKLGLNPQEHAGRLRELGYETSVCEQQVEDVMLLGQTDEFDIDPYEPVKLSHLVFVGRRLSMPIERVAERLRVLGVEVPDLAVLIRAALAKVPRRS